MLVPVAILFLCVNGVVGTCTPASVTECFRAYSDAIQALTITDINVGTSVSDLYTSYTTCMSPDCIDPNSADVYVSAYTKMNDVAATEYTFLCDVLGCTGVSFTPSYCKEAVWQNTKCYANFLEGVAVAIETDGANIGPGLCQSVELWANNLGHCLTELDCMTSRHSTVFEIVTVLEQQCTENSCNHKHLLDNCLNGVLPDPGVMSCNIAAPATACVEQFLTDCGEEGYTTLNTVLHGTDITMTSLEIMCDHGCLLNIAEFGATEQCYTEFSSENAPSNFGRYCSMYPSMLDCLDRTASFCAAGLNTMLTLPTMFDVPAVMSQFECPEESQMGDNSYMGCSLFHLTRCSSYVLDQFGIESLARDSDLTAWLESTGQSSVQVTLDPSNCRDYQSSNSKSQYETCMREFVRECPVLKQNWEGLHSSMPTAGMEMLNMLYDSLTSMIQMLTNSCSEGCLDAESRISATASCAGNNDAEADFEQLISDVLQNHNAGSSIDTNCASYTSLLGCFSTNYDGCEIGETVVSTMLASPAAYATLQLCDASLSFPVRELVSGGDILCNVEEAWRSELEFVKYKCGHEQYRRDTYYISSDRFCSELQNRIHCYYAHSKCFHVRKRLLQDQMVTWAMFNTLYSCQLELKTTADQYQGLTSYSSNSPSSEPEYHYGGQSEPEYHYGGQGEPEYHYGGQGEPEYHYGGQGEPEYHYGGQGEPEYHYGGQGEPEYHYSGQDYATGIPSGVPDSYGSSYQSSGSSVEAPDGFNLDHALKIEPLPNNDGTNCQLEMVAIWSCFSHIFSQISVDTDQPINDEAILNMLHFKDKVLVDRQLCPTLEDFHAMESCVSQHTSVCNFPALGRSVVDTSADNSIDLVPFSRLIDLPSIQSICTQNCDLDMLLRGCDVNSVAKAVREIQWKRLTSDSTEPACLILKRASTCIEPKLSDCDYYRTYIIEKLNLIRGSLAYEAAFKCQASFGIVPVRAAVVQVPVVNVTVDYSDVTNFTFTDAGAVHSNSALLVAVIAAVTAVLWL